MPDVVKNYYDAQWWVFIHLVPFAYLAIVACGVLAWWEQRTEYDAKDSGLTVINLRKNSDEENDQ